MVASPRRGRRPPIPLTLLTGFLGAGKTTLLNRLLKDPAFEKTAVVVNEFGEVALDHLLIESAEDDIIELSAGCICCTIRGDLIVALENLLRGLDNGRIAEIRRVVIETTGLADPAPILALLMRHPYLSLRFQLDGVVAVVDAVHVVATLAAHEEAAKQIAVADRIVLTKTGLGDAGAARARIARLNPGAVIFDAGTGEADARALVGLGPFDAEAKSADVRRWLAAEAYEDDRHNHDEDRNRHDDHITAFALVRKAAMPASAIDDFLDQLGLRHASKLMRVKALVAIADDPEHPVVLQGVQGMFSPPVALAGWPDDDHTSRLVVIGRDVDRAAIEALFDTFLGEPRPDLPDRQALLDNPLAIAGFPGPRR